MSLKEFGLVETNIQNVVVGEKFGRLIIDHLGQIKDTYRYYAVCSCLCGSRQKRVRVDSLVDGSIVSCGCYHSETQTKHGKTNNVHYKRWSGMLSRCNDLTDNAYKDYGGRGIKVCERWHDINKFILDLPDGFKKGLEIDRIDNDGNYEPNNVRWATRKQNCNNRRTTLILTFNGTKKPLTEWASELKINPQTVYNRLDAGWSTDDALTKPIPNKIDNMVKAQSIRWKDHVKKPKIPKTNRTIRRFMYNGENCTIARLSELCGVSKKLLSKRLLERKWGLEKAMKNINFKGSNQFSKD